MKQLKINVTDNKIFINEPVEINTGEYRVTVVDFTFPDAWSGLIKKAKFGEYTVTLVNNSCYFPIVLKAGVVSIKVFGYRETEQSGETVMELVYSPQPTNIRINQGSYDYEQGDTPIVPEPDEEYLNKMTLWGGYSTYFAALTDAPADAVTEFESVDITSMTLEEVVTEIEVINKMILDAHSGGGVFDVEVNGQSVVYDGVAQITIPPTPTIPVEDVKVNGTSVVDNHKVANVIVPTNYVTTNTNQDITAQKRFKGSNNLSGTTYTDGSIYYEHYHRLDGTPSEEDRQFMISFDRALENGGHLLWACKGLDLSGCYYELSKYEDGGMFQLAVTDDIPDVSSFVTNTVDNLINYYKKSETYSQSEVNSLIGAISTLNIQVVQVLPTQDISTTTIYLVPRQTAETSNVYDEYIYVSNAWEKIGSTDIDLSNYYTKTESDGKYQTIIDSSHKLSSDLVDDTNKTNKFVTASEKQTWNGKANVSDIPTSLSQLTGDSTHRLVTDTEKTAWNGKADTADIPTNNNQLTNGAGYQTASDVSTAIANNQFIAMYSKNVNDQWECNKTFAEIEMAILNKKEMIALVYETVQGTIFVRQYTISAHAIGSSIVWDNIDTDGQPTNGTFTVNSIGHISNGVVFVNASSFDFTLKEDVANKVTLIDSTSPSNTKYPSESAVVAYMNNVVGAINTTLDMINGTVI